MFWQGKRVTVTGGAGFLGTFLVKKLEELGAKEIFVPRREDYDLREIRATVRMLEWAKPDIVCPISSRNNE